MSSVRSGKQKAAVIGASGLLGGELLRVLDREGLEVHGTYYSRPGSGLVKLDITSQEAVRNFFDHVCPQWVFLAVNTTGGVDHCEAHPEQADALNVIGTQNIVEAASSFGARLIYYSTDYIFDGTTGPYSEDATACPVSRYGESKWQAEQVIREALPNALILRTTAVYGWNLRSRNFAMQVWERLSSGQTIRVPDDQYCNPTLAEYLAEASVRLAGMGVSGIVNIAGKDRLTRASFGRALARAIGLNPALIQPTPTAALGQKARRPLQAGFALEKLTQLLGTEPLDLSASLSRFRRRWRADTHVRYAPSAVSSEAEHLKQNILTKVSQYYELVHKPREFDPSEHRVQYAGRVFGAEEMVNLVESALDFWLTLGPYGEQFEQKMKRHLGARDFVIVNSGSSANLCAVLALMSPQLDRPLLAGDEVITPAVTFPTTLSPVVHSGLVPVFVDCELGTYNMNPRLIEGAVSARTRAILIPHTLGNPCNMDTICEVARRHSLYLIEDACDALGSRLHGKLVGTFGELATVSFYPAHHITMGEGGGVIVNDARLSRLVRSVRDWGRDCWCAPGESNTCGKRFGWTLGDLPPGYDHKYIYSNLGYNLKPTDLQAAVGLAQLDRVASFVAARRHNFDILYDTLKPFEEFLLLPKWLPDAEPAWFGFPITVKTPVTRAALTQWLEGARIETRMVFAGNILRQPAYRNIRHRVFGTLEQSDIIMRDTLFVGVYPGLTEAHLSHMVHAFQEFFHRFSKGQLAAASALD